MMDEKESTQHTQTCTISYRAPSWSWASVDQPVTWGTIYGTKLVNSKLAFQVQVKKVELISARGHNLGQPQDAKLKIQYGPMIHISGTEFPLKSKVAHYSGKISWLGDLRIVATKVKYDLDVDYSNIKERIYLLLLLGPDLASVLGPKQMIGLVEAAV